MEGEGEGVVLLRNAMIRVCEAVYDPLNDCCGALLTAACVSYAGGSGSNSGYSGNSSGGSGNGVGGNSSGSSSSGLVGGGVVTAERSSELVRRVLGVMTEMLLSAVSLFLSL